MKSKRMIALVLAALMLAAAAPAAMASEQIELRVLNYHDMTNANTADGIKISFDAFEEAHPEIKLVREDEFNEPFHQATEAYAASGNLPDVMYAWPSGRSTTLHTQKLLKDLAPLIERDGLAEYYIPLALNPASQAGGYQAILPMGVTATNAFFINMEVLDAVGLEPAKTYSELVAQVPVLAAAGYDTILMANQDTWVMQSCLFSLVAGRFCGEDWEQKILSGEAKFTDPDFVAALEFIKRMYDDGVLNQSTLATGYGEGPGLFATNTAAYYIDGDWRVGAFITDASTGEAVLDPSRQGDFPITVFPDIDLPGVKFNKSNTAVLGTGWGINAALEDGSPELEAAWELVKWLVGKEVQTWQVSTGAVATPARNDIDYSSLELEPLQVAIANLGGEYDVATVVIDGAFEGPVYTPLNDGLQAIGMGIQTPEQVAQSTQDAFDAWLASK
ncbi:MAG: extracellular solute-binding protein [Oscillospiraceae bacterium]|jgi:raffinose/stachyose/melibiose transport system substrate-binding protein|nr:extracellular solute-binding protein [Oscillospiraceae bacterium]